MAARDTAHTALTTLLAFIIVLLALAPVSGFAADEDQTLLLAVIVNNYPTNRIGEFVLRDGTLFARPQELSSLGFRVPESIGATKEGLVALSGLHDLSFRIDQSTQTLYVTAADESLLPQLLDAGASSDGAYKVESGTGLTLNYDLFGNSVDGQLAGSGLFDARAFSPWGVLSSGLLAYGNSDTVNAANNTAIRLDSTYVYSDPDTMRRYRAGDFISGFLPWTRAVRLGGIQITSDFSMRPDLITFPVPTLDGSVAVPSTVDVLVNGTKALSSQVQPGPFQIPQLPLVNGEGTISMSVTNALGQQVTTELPFYASTDLLAPGLQTYSGEAGFVRRDWGYVSDDYGSLAGALTYRRGLSQDFTIEAHGEGYPGLVMAGVGGALNVANFAIADFSIAGSTGPGHAGVQVWAGIQHIAQRFSFGASAIFASHDFADIAALNGDPVPRLQLNANVGLSLGRLGSFGLAYAGVERGDDFLPDGITSVAPPPPSLSGSLFIQPNQHAQIVYGSYSVGIGSVAFFANAFHDFANRNSDGVSVGITIALGSRTTASTSYQSQSQAQSYQAEVSQSANTVGEWGYRAFGALDDPDHAFAEASYKSPFALVTAGVDQLGKQTTVQAEAQGAVSYVDGGLFVSNEIDDSFAVVDTTGVGGIAVQQENRYAGRTDSDGQLLVPDLRAFEINHLSIDPLDAPVDSTVPYASRDVRPQDRSGVVVMFPIKISNGALLQLTDAAGAPLPYGSVATLHSSGVKVPVGYDGEAYFVDLEAHNKVSVEMPDGRRCDAGFDYQHVTGKIPSIGPLACREAQP
jgi:outer membrane usher protein